MIKDREYFADNRAMSVLSLTCLLSAKHIASSVVSLDHYQPTHVQKEESDTSYYYVCFTLFISVSLHAHSVIQQTFVEHLLFSRHSSGPWEFNTERDVGGALKKLVV